VVPEPRAVRQVVNIGNTEGITIGDLAARIRTLAQSRSEIVLVPYEEAYQAGFEDMPRRVAGLTTIPQGHGYHPGFENMPRRGPDLTKIRQAIGYRPTMDLDEILRAVINFERVRGQRYTGNVQEYSRQVR